MKEIGIISHRIPQSDDPWVQFAEDAANVVLTPDAASSKMLIVHFDDGRNATGESQPTDPVTAAVP